LSLCSYLYNTLSSQYKIIFRPHPSELFRVKDFTGKFIIDKNNDIYSSFETAQIIVGEVSTGLFEAIGLVPNIYLLKTPRSDFSIPTHPFISIDSKEDLIKEILFNSNKNLSLSLENYVWKRDWKNNYVNFINMII